MTTMSGTPAYLQVAADLRSQIERGTLRPGAQLPSSSQLRQIYSVSNTVIRDAINELRRAGLVIGQQGKGVFVRDAEAMDGESPALTVLVQRIQALEDRIDTPDQEDLSAEVQSLRHQVAVLQTFIIDLYTRMGYPYPREMADEIAGEVDQPEPKRASRRRASRSA